MFLFGGAVGGTQQEIARATHPNDGAAPSPRALHTFTTIAIFAVVALGVSVSVAISGTSFTSDPLTLSVAFIIGLIGYVLTSILTGVFYGIGALQSVSALIAVDAILRGAAVILGLVLGAPVGILAVAVTLPFIASVMLVWWASRSTLRGNVFVDASSKTLLRNSLRTVGASAAIGVMVAGLPLVLDVFLQDATSALVASLVLTLTVTRAPLIIPLMALQSYLVVQFRGLHEGLRRRVFLILGCLVAVGLIAASAGALLGPAIVDLVGEGRYQVDGLVVGVIVGSAALIGMMCVTSAALIALHRHNLYFIGWGVAAMLTIVILAVAPMPALPRALVAICAPAMVGLMVHVVAIVRAKSRASLPLERGEN